VRNMGKMEKKPEISLTYLPPFTTKYRTPERPFSIAHVVPRATPKIPCPALTWACLLAYPAAAALQW
jgi:hypothetical protein